MISNNFPDSRPLQPNPPHVVVRNLYYLLQTKHPGMGCRQQFIHRYSTKPSDKIHCSNRRESTLVIYIQTFNILIGSTRPLKMTKKNKNKNTKTLPIAFPSSLVEPVNILQGTQNIFLIICPVTDPPIYS